MSFFVSLAAVVVSALTGANPTLGAISTWTQTSWSGGADGGVGAVHPDDQAGWTKYASLDGASASISPGDIKLSTQNFTATDDGTLTTTGTATGGGFSNGTTATTAVTGSGASASVGLTPTTTVANTFNEGTIPRIPGTVNYGTMIRNGADDDVYVFQGLGTGFYKYSISANTWTTLTAVPAAGSFGFKVIRNGADNDIYVLRGGTGFYKYSISTNTWTTLTAVPAAVSFGSFMIRNGADDDIYVLRGNTSTDFYKYSISGNSWTTLTPVPATVSSGGAMLRNGADDDIYVLTGGTGFYKYSISGNTWTALTAVPGAAYLGSMIRNGADNDIYVLRGGNGFYKYSISGNSWTTLTAVPGAVDAGGAMLRNGADNDIYVLQGFGTGFYRYSISANTWTTLTAVPVMVSSGGTMIRNGADNDIYVLPGGNRDGFNKYSIAGNTWVGTGTSTLAAVPGPVGAGASMIRNGADDDIYVLRGSGSTGFYKYSISANTWTTLAAVPGAVGDGAKMIRNGADDDIYVLRGSSSTSFYKYSISGNTWTTLTAVPAGVNSGGSMIRNGTDDDIYVLRGAGQTSFYKYSISSNTWTTLTAVPAGVNSGGSMIRNGADNDIYVLRGNSSNVFYKYSISDNAWTTLAGLPANVGSGVGMIRNGADDDIYVLGGGTSFNSFYKYSISGNSWTTLTGIPAPFNTAAMIRNGADNDIYALPGYNNTGFYRYSISGNIWTALPSVSGTVSSGGRMIRNGADQQIYILQGDTSTNLWRYTINDVTYPAAGTFTSAVIDTAGVTALGNLSWSSTLPTGTTLTFATRSGATPVPDGTWSAWSAELSTSGSAIASPAARYIQYRGTFGTSSAAVTPTLSDLTLAYAAYQPSGSLTSSSFDAVEEANVIGGLSWTEDAAMPAGTSVTVSLRTASSSGGLTGPWTDFTRDATGCAKTGGDVVCGASAIPSALASGSDDRYQQYKVTLATSDGAVTPTVGEVAVTYGLAAAGGGQGTITVIKSVVNDNGGTKVAADFPLFVNGVLVSTGVSNSFPAPAAAYSVTETGDPKYTLSFKGDCDANGRLTLTPGEQKVCIVTNDDIGSVEATPPIIDLVKVPSPLSLPDGPGLVTYAYTLRNLGTVPVTDVELVGDTCAPVELVSGDLDADARLDVDETWTYACTTTLTETHTNIVVATGWANGISASDIASATVVVGAQIAPPLIHVTKFPSPLTLPSGGGLVTYTETITNPGSVPLENVRIVDDMCAPVTRVSGDVNGDERLDPSEAWIYTCTSNLTRTTVNTAVATGQANGLTARDFAIVTVIVPGSQTSYTAADALATALTISIDKSLGEADSTPCAPETLIKPADDGLAATQRDSAVYYCGTDGKRYVFPDPGAYFSWYRDFSAVQTVPSQALAAVPLAGNVTYRPGSRLLKIESDPRVYAVEKGGVLRWVTDEPVAATLYGSAWNTKVSDIPVALFAGSYRIGDPITAADAASACATTTTFTAYLAPGMSDPEVQALQDLLRCLGHFPADVLSIGYYGPSTESAVKAFQTANGIAPVGFVGPETREALNRYTER